MTQSLTNRHDVRLLLVASLGNQLGKPVFQQICLWEKSSGLEWTVKRLKAIRVSALQSRGGCFNEAKLALREASVEFKNTPLGPVPKGCWGPVIYRFLSSQKPSVIKRLSLALRVYTAIHLVKTSETQYIKALKSIILEPKSKGRYFYLHSFLEDEYFFSFPDPGPLKLYGQQALEIMGISPGKLVLEPPNVQRLRPFSSYYRSPGTTPPGEVAYHKMVGSMLSQVYLPDSLKDLNPLEDMRLSLINETGDNDVHPGKITFIQEAGAKARVIAIPNFWLQFLFEPLHKALDKFISHLPLSCVHDQTSGGWFLDSHIRENKKCWCYDLSSATDRFPRAYQLHILRSFGLNDYADALEEVCEAPWLFPELKLDGKTVHGARNVRYTIGQPMGLYASFPLFHLTHYYLLVACSLKHGHNDLKSMPFVVLGDDVVITDGDVAQEYSSWLTQHDVEHLGPKSIASSRVGEFAGFLSIKTKRGSTTFRPYKFGRPKNGFGDKAIPLLACLGNHCQLLGHPWGKIYNLYSYTKEWRDLDLTSLIHSPEPWALRPRPVASEYIVSVVNLIGTQGYVDMSVLYCDTPAAEGLYDYDHWGTVLTGEDNDTPYVQSDRVYLEHDISIPEKRSNFQHEQDLLKRISADPLLADQKSVIA